MASLFVLIVLVLLVGSIAAGSYRRFSGPTGDEVASSFHQKLLYEIDRLRVQMQIVNERLERLEGGYRALPRGDDEGTAAPTPNSSSPEDSV